MSILSTFTFHTTPVRVVLVNGIPWFIAKDVALTLEYTDADYAIKTYCKKAKTLTELIPGYSAELSLHFQTKLINEADVSSLSMYSNIKQVEEFQFWITNKVLPSILPNNGVVNSTIDFNDPKQVMELLSEQNRQLVRAVEKIEALQPKADFHDNVLSAEGLMSMNQAAKSLGTGRTRLYSFLREKKILIPDGKDRNLPYQTYITREWFKVIETLVERENGIAKLNPRTMVTPKGLAMIHLVLLKYEPPLN